MSNLLIGKVVNPITIPKGELTMAATYK